LVLTPPFCLLPDFWTKSKRVFLEEPAKRLLLYLESDVVSEVSAQILYPCDLASKPQAAGERFQSCQNLLTGPSSRTQTAFMRAQTQEWHSINDTRMLNSPKATAILLARNCEMAKR